MKFDASDIIVILRLFKLASSDQMPRLVERIEKSKPHEKSVLIKFRFQKDRYALIIDNTAEDDESFILSQINTSDKESYKLLANPLTAELSTYGFPFKGKDCYLLVDAPDEIRLDIALVERIGEESRSTYQKLISSGSVLVNGEVVDSVKAKISSTDVVEVRQEKAVFEKPPIDIIYEDEHVLVINKQVGLLTHAKGVIIDEYTAADVMEGKTSYKADTNRPGVVHRLDRATSGVLLLVKTDEAAKKIQKQFSDRTVKKIYMAIVEGEPTQPKALIDLPIGRNPTMPSTFRVDSNGKPAQTIYEVVRSTGDKSLVRLKPKTGRTHQLRVHMQYVGCPIIGDHVYGTGNADRMYLHAASLELTLPGGERMVFEAPVPDSFEKKMDE
jgi:23S rRNA pseudouridine1911/1915/1917 synthase